MHLIAYGSKEEVPRIKLLAHEWGKAFLACGRAGMRGFSRENFTPYSHKLMTHSGHMVSLLGPLERFTGEQLEHLNDDMKKGHMRQTNCQNIEVSLFVQKRRERALMNFALKKKERDEKRTPKHSCQHPYQGFGARAMAQERREADAEATRQATAAYQDPREMQSSAELRAQLVDRTGESQYYQLMLSLEHVFFRIHHTRRSPYFC